MIARRRWGEAWPGEKVDVSRGPHDDNGASMRTPSTLQPPGSLPRLCALLLVQALALALALTGCTDGERGEPPSATGSTTSGAAPVILVGVDGLEWKVVAEMVAAGRLPVLRR